MKELVAVPADQIFLRKLVRVAVRVVFMVALAGIVAAIVFPVVGYAVSWVLHEFTGRDQFLTLTTTLVR